MKRFKHFLVRCLVLTIFITIFPVMSGSENISSDPTQSQKKQSKKKRKSSPKSSSQKSSAKKKSSSTKKRKKTSTKKRPSKKRSTKSSKKTRTKKSAPKKKTAPKKRSSKKTPKRRKASVVSTPKSRSSQLPSRSVYEVSDNLYQMTYELDGMIQQMRKVHLTLKPIEKRPVKVIDEEKLRLVESKVFQEPENYHAQRELAVEYERKGMYSRAKDIYLRMIASDPSNADYHYYLGSFYSKTGQPKRARFAFEEALEINPDHVATINALTGYSGRPESDEMATDLIQKASHREREGPARYLNDVQGHIKSGSYDDAVSVSQEARSRFPDNSIFPYLEGQAYQADGDIENAKKSYKLSMTLDKTDPSPAVALANLYFNQGNYIYAAINYENALQMNPMDVNLRHKNGLSYFKAYEWGKAASAWEDLLHYSPNHSEVRKLLPQTYYILSLEYHRNGFIDLGRRSFANALSVNPRSGEWIGGALMTAGEYYREYGLYRNALNAYQDAIELDPANAGGYNGLGITYWYMGEKEMAVAAWEKSLNLQPEDNGARGWLLLANRRSGS